MIKSYNTIYKNDFYGIIYYIDETGLHEYKKLLMKDIVTSTLTNDIKEGGTLDVKLKDVDFVKELIIDMSDKPFYLVRYFDGVNNSVNNSKLYFLYDNGYKEMFDLETQVSTYEAGIIGYDFIKLCSFKTVINNRYNSTFETTTEGTVVKPDTWCRYIKTASVRDIIDEQLSEIFKEGVVLKGYNREIVEAQKLKNLGSIDVTSYTTDTVSINREIEGTDTDVLSTFMQSQMIVYFYNTIIENGKVKVVIEHIDKTIDTNFDVNWKAQYNKPELFSISRKLSSDFKSLVYNVNDQFKETITFNDIPFLHTSVNFISDQNADTDVDQYNQDILNSSLSALQVYEVEYSNLPKKPFLEFDVGSSVGVIYNIGNEQKTAITFVQGIEEIIEGDERTITVKFLEKGEE